MKTNKQPLAVAQAAKKREEKQKEKVLREQNQKRLKEAMNALEKMQGRTCITTGTNNTLRKEKHLDFPTTEQLSCIVEYGSHDDIMKMIRAYANADHILEDEATGYQETTPHPYPLPDQIGTMIAIRNNSDEISAFVNNQGFGADGQDVLLKRGNHKELMWYLDKHGFLPQQQRKLIKRGYYDEIRRHILHHSLADELLDELLAELANGETKNFYKFISMHELPVQKQEAFLKIAKEEEFMAYIERYGFWQQVLPCLVRARSVTELAAYINKHRYLGKGVYDLAQRKNPQLNKLYIAKQCDTPLQDMIRAFSSVQNPDRDILAKLYAQVPRPKHTTQKEDDTLIILQDGMRNEVMKFLKEQRPKLDPFAEATLFFRNLKGEYELYLDILKWHDLDNKIEQAN